jgi:predicted nucleotide-binding protein (sugar kinase/HSP70/actin superfamily)
MRVKWCGVWLGDWLGNRPGFEAFQAEPDTTFNKKRQRIPYYPSGGESIETVGKTLMFHKKGIDGVLHIMPFTCMPELVASAVIHRISKERDYPVLSMIFDEHVSEANMVTRLEAFADLLERRKCEGVSRN